MSVARKTRGSWWRRLWGALPASLIERPQPTRVGLLDTGELVLMDHLGRAQVISPATAELIHQTLSRHRLTPAHGHVPIGQPFRPS